MLRRGVDSAIQRTQLLSAQNRCLVASISARRGMRRRGAEARQCSGEKQVDGSRPRKLEPDGDGPIASAIPAESAAMTISFVSVQWVRNFLKLLDHDVQAFWGLSGLLRQRAQNLTSRAPCRSIAIRDGALRLFSGRSFLVLRTCRGQFGIQSAAHSLCRQRERHTRARLGYLSR
jgi:hypothetical protein